MQFQLIQHFLMSILRFSSVYIHFVGVTKEWWTRGHVVRYIMLEVLGENELSQKITYLGASLMSNFCSVMFEQGCTQDLKRLSNTVVTSFANFSFPTSILLLHYYLELTIVAQTLW